MRGDIVYVNGRWNRAVALLTRYTPEWLVNRVLKRYAKKFRRA